MSLLTRLLGNVGATRTAPAQTIYDIFLRNRRQDVRKWHHYFDIYERYFAPLRGQPLRVLEIGVARGGSLRIWREYFGPSATICGVDSNPNAAACEREGYRIFIGDQADRGFLRKVSDEVGPIDILIDDGGHTMLQQVNTFEELYSQTRLFYVVEDTHTSYWKEFQDRPAGTFIDYAKANVDKLHEWHYRPESKRLYEIAPAQRTQNEPVSTFCAHTRAVHFYDSIVVFEKGENAPRWHETR